MAKANDVETAAHAARLSHPKMAERDQLFYVGGVEHEVVDHQGCQVRVKGKRTGGQLNLPITDQLQAPQPGAPAQYCLVTVAPINFSLV